MSELLSSVSDHLLAPGGVTIESLQTVLGDLAYVYHWPPPVLWDLEWDEALEWRELAMKRMKAESRGR